MMDQLVQQSCSKASLSSHPKQSYSSLIEVPDNSHTLSLLGHVNDAANMKDLCSWNYTQYHLFILYDIDLYCTNLDALFA